nr:amidohydrolase family protein [Bacteroidota bacterium]
GLTLEGELKMLRVIKKLKEKSSVTIKSTFLGAHAYPAEYRENHEGYIDILVNIMLPLIAKEKLADYIDVFCEKGFFSSGEMEVICNAGKRSGLKPRLHVNQLNSIGGIESGIALDALSLDHLETLNEKEIDMLGRFDGASTLLPSAAFFLKMPYQPARELISAGAAVTLASDYNPGSSPSGNMNFVVSLGCIQMQMLPEESINAATYNGACAMEIQENYGSIAVGKRANLIFTKPVSSLAYLPYSFGNNLIDKVMINGEFI